VGQIWLLAHEVERRHRIASRGRVALPLHSEELVGAGDPDVVDVAPAPLLGRPVKENPRRAGTRVRPLGARGSTTHDLVLTQDVTTMSDTRDTGVTLAVLTPEERLSKFDEELEQLKDELVDAIRQLQQAPEVDDSWKDRFRETSDRLSAMGDALQPDFDKGQVVDFYRALVEIGRVTDGREKPYDLDTYEGLLLRIERIRHTVRDALDEHVPGVHDDVGLVIDDLERWLPHTPKKAIADLVGINPRTLSRWAKLTEPPDRRLAIVARLVAILRRNWTEEGVLAWFYRPRRDLAGRKPASLIGDPHAEDALIMAARAGRSQYAT
jgi:hypothetical protein